MNILPRTHSYMFPEKEQFYITENYVSSPPAVRVTDERNDVWTIGYKHQTYLDAPKGEFSFNVLRNGIDTGEFASRIERYRGRIRIFTRQGYKHWNGRFFI